MYFSKAESNKAQYTLNYFGVITDVVKQKNIPWNATKVKMHLNAFLYPEFKNLTVT
jgi:hypothetical protein